MQRGDSDIGWADLYIIPDRARFEIEIFIHLDLSNHDFLTSRLIDYTDPYDIEYACFMLSKPPPLPQWQALTTPLQPPVCIFFLFEHFCVDLFATLKVWLATLLSLVIVNIAFALLTQPDWSKEPKFGFIDSKSKTHVLLFGFSTGFKAHWHCTHIFIHVFG